MNRSLLLMLVIALVLVGLVLLLANPFQDSLKREDREWTGLFDGTKVRAADRVEIATAADTTVLVRRGDVWLVTTEGDFPADTAAVGNLLRAVENARSAGVASNNPENRAKFQVDVSGVGVKVTAGGALVAAFTLGKMGADFTTSYVLPAGSDDVHIVRGMNRNLFSRAQGMRDRTLFRFDPAVLSEVTARTPDGGWVLARVDSSWTVRKPGEIAGHPAKHGIGEQLARTLSNLAADGFVDNPSDTLDTGLASPAYTFQVRLMNGTEASISVGKKNDRNQYYVSRAGQKVIFTLGEWRLINLAKKIEDLIGP